MLDHPFPKGTCLTVGDSMLAGYRPKSINNWRTQSQSKILRPGASMDDMYDYMKPLLWKLPDYIIFPIGTNDALDYTSREILDNIFKMKMYIEN